MDIAVAEIAVRSDARSIDRLTVQGLAESIAAVGLINPVRVRAVGDGYELIAGAHRLAAFKALGLVEIAADVVVEDDLHAELAMIDENLCRAELSPADRARQTARRKAIYEELHPETVIGVNQHTRVGQVVQPNFAQATAALTGVDQRTVRRDAERGEKVIDEVLGLIRGTKLDTGAYLDKLKKLTPNDQVAAAKRDLSALRQAAKVQPLRSSAKSKIDSDVKARAAKEIAAIITEHVPGEWWDAVKANLYAAGASNIAHELTNITGQSVMDRGAA